MIKRGLIILTTLFILNGCVTGSNLEDNHETMSGNAVETLGIENDQMRNIDDTAGNYISYDAYIEYETLDFDLAKASLMDLLEKQEALLENENESLYDGHKNYFISIKLPVNNYETFIDQAKILLHTELISITQGSQDLEVPVQDLEIRLKAVNSRIQRLETLLEEAVKVEDILAIQRELENAFLERDQILSDQDYYAKQIDYVNIQLNLNEVSLLSQNGNQSFGEEVIQRFRQSIMNIKYVFKEALFIIIDSIPYLLLAIIILGPAFYFVRYWLKNKVK